MPTFKKPSSLPVATSLADTDRFMPMTSAGLSKLISWSSLKSLIKTAVTPDAATATVALACDNVMIAYTQNSDTDAIVRYSKIEDWPSRAAANYAIGVLVVSGNQRFIVAPTEAASPLKWASATSVDIPNLTNITAKDAAASDFAGKANTAAIIAGSTSAAVTNTDQYAAGFCNKYSRLDSKSHGIPAGSWYLPTLGQLLIMYAYKNQIKHALSLIAGSSAPVDANYWSSTEYSAGNAWLLLFSAGGMYYTNKSSEFRVRPVAALA